LTATAEEDNNIPNNGGEGHNVDQPAEAGKCLTIEGL